MTKGFVIHTHTYSGRLPLSCVKESIFHPANLPYFSYVSLNGASDSIQCAVESVFTSLHTPNLEKYRFLNSHLWPSSVDSLYTLSNSIVIFWSQHWGLIGLKDVWPTCWLSSRNTAATSSVGCRSERDKKTQNTMSTIWGR